MSKGTTNCSNITLDAGEKKMERSTFLFLRGDGPEAFMWTKGAELTGRQIPTPLVRWRVTHKCTIQAIQRSQWRKKKEDFPGWRRTCRRCSSPGWCVWVCQWSGWWSAPGACCFWPLSWGEGASDQDQKTWEERIWIWNTSFIKHLLLHQSKRIIYHHLVLEKVNNSSRPKNFFVIRHLKMRCRTKHVGHISAFPQYNCVYKYRYIQSFTQEEKASANWWLVIHFKHINLSNRNFFIMSVNEASLAELCLCPAVAWRVYSGTSSPPSGDHKSWCGVRRKQLCWHLFVLSVGGGAAVSGRQILRRSFMFADSCRWKQMLPSRTTATAASMRLCREAEAALTKPELCKVQRARWKWKHNFFNTKNNKKYVTVWQQKC